MATVPKIGVDRLSELIVSDIDKARAELMTILQIKNDVARLRLAANLLEFLEHAREHATAISLQVEESRRQDTGGCA